MFSTYRHIDQLRARLLLAVAFLFVLVLGCAAAPATVWAASKEDAAADNVLADEKAGFGLTDFTRYQTGNNRLVEGVDIGYRYPLADDANVVIVVTADGEALAFVDEGACAEAGFAADDATDVAALRALAETLDDRVAKGGETLADDPGRGWTVGTATEAVFGAFRVRVGVEAGGRRYVSVVPADLPNDMTPSSAAAQQGLDLSEALRWVDTALLVPSSAVNSVTTMSPVESIASFFASLDMRPFWVSLKTSVVALIVTFVLGLFAAWRCVGTSGRVKSLLDSVFTIPMVLPPTVCGFLLLLLFGQATPIGRWLIDHGVSLVFTWEAAVISAVVVSFPLMYRTALGAFESLDARMLDAARTLGWSEGRIFCRLMLPLAWPSIAAGTVLAFARAMGEFGCTLFFAGNYAGVTQTIPIAIYFEWMSGNTDVALFWVVVVILMSFAVVLFINLYTARSQRYRTHGGVRMRARARREAFVGATGIHRKGADDTADGGIRCTLAVVHASAAGGTGARCSGFAGDDLLATYSRDEDAGDALRIDADALRALLSDGDAGTAGGEV